VIVKLVLLKECDRTPVLTSESDHRVIANVGQTTLETWLQTRACSFD
jgi:hypothetical protein